MEPAGAAGAASSSPLRLVRAPSSGSSAGAGSEPDGAKPRSSLRRAMRSVLSVVTLPSSGARERSASQSSHSQSMTPLPVMSPLIKSPTVAKNNSDLAVGASKAKRTSEVSTTGSMEDSRTPRHLNSKEIYASTGSALSSPLPTPHSTHSSPRSSALNSRELFIETSLLMIPEDINEIDLSDFRLAIGTKIISLESAVLLLGKTLHIFTIDATKSEYRSIITTPNLLRSGLVKTLEALAADPSRGFVIGPDFFRQRSESSDWEDEQDVHEYS